MTTAETSDPLEQQAMLVASLLDQLGVMDSRARGRARAARPLAALVLAGFDRLLAHARSAATDEPPSPPPMTREEAHTALVGSVREHVLHHVPAGAHVAVISRGDRQLIDLPGLHGSHFPQDERGAWAGFYPATGVDAVAHLELVRHRGAGWLAIPASASWWLDHYGELRHHLATTASLVTDDPAVALWALRPVRPEEYRPPASPPLAQLVRALVPGDASVLVMLHPGQPNPPSLLDAVRTLSITTAGVTTWRSAIDTHAQHGGSFVVLPEDAAPWRSSHPELWHHLASKHTVVADRAGLGTIFELHPSIHHPEGAFTA